MSVDLAQGPTRFGGMVLPFHLPGQSPTVLLDRDLEYIEAMDRLGFQEAWSGEHHSTGIETIPSPEMFLTAAAQRTERIRLGTGVISVPYHNPFMVATRLAFLDQLSHGRAIGGLGPGQLPSDSHMLALDSLAQRDQLTEGAEVILKLLRGETVTAKTDWFELKDARLQLRPYSVPELEMVIAATISPAGPRNAGRFGTGMINFAAASDAGFEALRGHWAIAEEEAELHGQSVSRESWRLMCLMHLAETEEQAIAEVEYGLPRLWEFIGQIAAFGGDSAPTTKELVRMVNSQGMMIGTPEMAIEKIRELAAQSGGFGCFLMGLGEFGDHAATMRSIELFATYVIPEFRGQLQGLQSSYDWVLSEKREKAERTRWSGEAAAAIQKATDDYEAEKARRNS